jgi:hypothetical protein
VVIYEMLEAVSKYAQDGFWKGKVQPNGKMGRADRMRQLT